MDRQYCYDLLKCHLVDGQPLTALQVSNIVGFELAEAKDFEERLSGRWWHNSHEPFPEGWTEEDQAAAERASALDTALALVKQLDENGVRAIARHCLSELFLLDDTMEVMLMDR